jgi:hypothetical protein
MYLSDFLCFENKILIGFIILKGGKKGYRAIKNGQGDRGSPQSLVTDPAN